MFFFLSKVISFIIDPFFWIIFLFLTAVFHRKIYKRKKKFKTGLLLLILFSNSLVYNFVNDLWCNLHYKSKNHYDFGILLGGMISLTSTENNINFSSNNDRILNTLDLFSKKKIDKILITGASGSLTSELKESEILKKYFIKLGIPDSCIFTENKSKNTYENACFSDKLLTDSLHRNDISCLLITSDYHMRRSIACFNKTNLKCHPFIKKNEIKHFDLEWIILPQSNVLFKWKILFHEMVGHLTYIAMGYI